MQMWHRRKVRDVWQAVWEKHSSQFIARREKQRKEKMSCFGENALPKKYDICVESGGVNIWMRSH